MLSHPSANSFSPVADLFCYRVFFIIFESLMNFFEMEDGRRNNGGNKNAGRKPKAEEIKIIEQMDAVMIPYEVWQALAAKVESGDVLATKTWLQYRYGMPKQIVENTNINIEEKELTPEMVKLIKDNLKNAY